MWMTLGSLSPKLLTTHHGGLQVSSILGDQPTPSRACPALLWRLVCSSYLLCSVKPYLVPTYGLLHSPFHTLPSFQNLGVLVLSMAPSSHPQVLPCSWARGCP